jgi:hypothetical protein
VPLALPALFSSEIGLAFFHGVFVRYPECVGIFGPQAARAPSDNTTQIARQTLLMR